MIRIVIVDDHAILRRGLAQIIAENADMQVVGEAASSSEALRLLRENPATWCCWTCRCPTATASKR